MGKSDEARAAMVCHYEAGRALACWWGGVGLVAINMPWNPMVELYPGARAEALGVWAGKDYLDRFLMEETAETAPPGGTLVDWVWREWGRMEVAIMTCYAGNVAWARHRKRAVGSCLVRDGKADVERAEAILEAYLMRANLVGHSAASCRDTALTWATVLVRSRQGWTAVSSIADWLWQCGFVSSREIDEMCFAAFGARPPDVGWDPHWPASLGAPHDGGMGQGQPSRHRGRERPHRRCPVRAPRTCVPDEGAGKAGHGPRRLTRGIPGSLQGSSAGAAVAGAGTRPPGAPG